jgi:hypothetical protein
MWPNCWRQRTAFATDCGRSALVRGIGLDAPIRPLRDRRPNGSVRESDSRGIACEGRANKWIIRIEHILDGDLSPGRPRQGRPPGCTNWSARLVARAAPPLFSLLRFAGVNVRSGHAKASGRQGPRRTISRHAYKTLPCAFRSRAISAMLSLQPPRAPARPASTLADVPGASSSVPLPEKLSPISVSNFWGALHLRPVIGW